MKCDLIHFPFPPHAARDEGMRGRPGDTKQHSATENAFGISQSGGMLIALNFEMKLLNYLRWSDREKERESDATTCR